MNANLYKIVELRWVGCTFGLGSVSVSIGVRTDQVFAALIEADQKDDKNDGKQENAAQSGRNNDPPNITTKRVDMEGNRQRRSRGI